VLSMFKSFFINSLKHNTSHHFILYDLMHFLP
ncbi:glutamate decarboxylase isozyme, partial [Escherichia coli]